ncbi:Ent-kaurene synthase [Nemania sp. NC0429]|nr:Ent-kaurene synthase [Nemania sp. NC0429]
MDLSLSKRANMLVAGLTAQLTNRPTRSFLSASVYDTAWLAMVQHPKTSHWLFPDCFNFILDNPPLGGDWDAHTSRLDRILGTAASLLAVQKHLKTQPLDQNLISRSHEVKKALVTMLESWEFFGSDQLLVSAHVLMLRDEGVDLKFRGLDRLQEIYQEGISQLPAETAYKGVSALYHSPAALTGHIDFDKVACSQEENGSIMCSPSYTAVYLMYSPRWDDKAEEYLRNVLKNCPDLGGGVPSAWPTTVFEASRVFSILTEAAIPVGEHESSIIRGFLEQSLAAHHGTVGFSPSTLPDANNTAMAIIALNLLGVHLPVTPLLDAFGTGSHFKTCPGEQNPSFTVNCNVLICLLSMDDPRPYTSEIAKVAEFVCTQASTGKINDHTHDLYQKMLMCRVIARLCEKLNEVSLGTGLFEMSPQLQTLIPLVSLQILTNLSAGQDENGSWEDACEPTAYAILALSAASRLPWVQSLYDSGIPARIDRAKCYLNENRDKWHTTKILWAEKASFSSNILSETYCLAAVVSEPASHHRPKVLYPFSLPENIARSMRKCRTMIQQTPLFAGVNSQVLEMAETQACYIFCLLQQQPTNIFPREENHDAKYKIITPIIWTACNALHGCVLSLSHLLEMTSFSMLIYQVDEFMELTVERDLGDRLPFIASLIRKICNIEGYISGPADGNVDHNGGLTPLSSASINSSAIEDTSEVTNVKGVITRFVQYALKNSIVVESPIALQSTLRAELETFLKAHIVQASDNQRFAAQHGGNRASAGPLKRQGGVINAGRAEQSCGDTALEFSSPGRTFYKWVHTTAADHTSCPFSYTFYNCLLSDTYPGLFATAKTSYLAEDLCRHLASLCRMYNDVGSMARDEDEYNLNSANFSEFHCSDGPRRNKEEIRSELMWIAEYERAGLEKALSLLKSELGAELFGSLNVFVDVTDLYGQIYLQRDLTSRQERLHAA